MIDEVFRFPRTPKPSKWGFPGNCWHLLCCHSAPALVFMLLFMTAVLPPLSHFSEHLQWDSIPVALVFAIVLLAVAKYNHDRGMRLVVIMSISFHMVFRLFLQFSASHESIQDEMVKSLRIGVSIAFMGLVIAILIRHLWTSRISGGDSLWVASALYLMMAILFAQVYTLTYMLDPQSFRIDGDLDRIGEGHPAHHNFPVFLYFSTVVISTVGFGDITPVSRFARAFTWFEALGGQMYLVILMGRIVSMQLTTSTPSVPAKKRKKKKRPNRMSRYGVDPSPAPLDPAQTLPTDWGQAASVAPIHQDDPSAVVLARIERPAEEWREYHARSA